MVALCPNFLMLNPEQKLTTILCPATPELAKCVSKFLGILSDTRKEIDLDFQRENLQIYLEHKFSN